MTSWPTRYVQSTPLKFTSQSLGLAVMIILIIQVILGFVSHTKFSPDRPRIPWCDKVHWWLGRIVSILALVTCFRGLEAFGASMVWKVTFISWVVFALIVCLAGEYSVGQVNHIGGILTRSRKSLPPTPPDNRDMPKGDLLPSSLYTKRSASLNQGRNGGKGRGGSGGKRNGPVKHGKTYNVAAEEKLNYPFQSPQDQLYSSDQTVMDLDDSISDFFVID